MNPRPKHGLFQALSNPDRRTILEFVVQSPGIKVMDLCALFETSKFSILKHLNILEETGLITRIRVGKERHVHATLDGIKDNVLPWLSALMNEHKKTAPPSA